MRIVFVIHSFLPDGIGGSEVYTFRLATELGKRHEVTVFRRVAQSERPEFELQRSQYRGIPVLSVNNTLKTCRSFEMTYRNETVEQLFTGALRDIRPDVVHFMHLACLSLGLPQVCASKGISSVMTLHDYYLLCPRGQMLTPSLERCGSIELERCCRCLAPWLALSPASKLLHRFALGLLGSPFNRNRLVQGLYRLLRRGHLATARSSFLSAQTGSSLVQARIEAAREAARNISVFIAPSRFLMQKHIAFGIPAQKIICSDYGFDPALCSSARRRPSGAPVKLAFLGSIIPSKGLHVALAALSGFDASRIQLEVHGGFAPYDEHDDYPREIAAAAKRAPVRLCGPVANDEIGLLFSQADALLVPSIWDENSPLVIHEAMLAGLPVIASSCGGITELVRNGENGLLFEPGSAEGLREVLSKVASNPQLLADLRPEAARVKSIAQDAAEIEALYRKAAA